MKPQTFSEANVILNPPKEKSEDNIGNTIEPLAAFTDGKQCLSCWRMTWRERVSALFFGRVWICLLTGRTQPPIWADVNRKFPT